MMARMLTIPSRWFAALALAAGVACAGCSGGEAQQQTAQPTGRGGGQNTPVPVTSAPVQQKTVPLDVHAIGTVIAASTVSVHAQITGELTSVNFKEGDEVKEGMPLFTLDKRPFEAALQQAEAQLQKDQAQATNAKAQAARYQDLLQRGIATREQVDQMNTQLAALEATLASDRANIQSAKVQLDYATIEAPISGRTGLLQVHKGNLVRANDTTPIVVINRITPVYVTFAVPTIKVKGTFPNEDRRLTPGQFVNVTVTLTADRNVTVIPTPAVQSGQQGTFVYVIKDDKTVELRPISVARTHGEDSIIASGLKPGETIVLDGQLRLIPGSRVSIKDASSEKSGS